MNFTYGDVVGTASLVVSVVVGWKALSANTKIFMSKVVGLRIAFFVGLHAYLFVGFSLSFVGSGVLLLVAFVTAKMGLAVDSQSLGVLAGRLFGFSFVFFGLGVVYERVKRTPIRPFCVAVNSDEKGVFSWWDLLWVLTCLGAFYIMTIVPS